MKSNHAYEVEPTCYKLLAVSFAYPPLVYPRSIQVARLLRHLHASTVVVCAEEENYRRDSTIEPDAEALLDACLRVPFAIPDWRKLISLLSSRFQLPFWHKLPDQYVSWKPLVLRNIAEFVCANHYKPDILVTFGQPMSDHLIGLEIHRQYRVPWVAHFSDPWVDNPFNNYDSLTRMANVSLERKVVKMATLLIFTSQETLNLVMAKYPKQWEARARVIPHAFDSRWYPIPTSHPADKITIRYLGELYGPRTPKPLVDALRVIVSQDPSFLAGVRLELIGPADEATLEKSGIDDLPKGLVVIKSPVSYLESLSLMVSADGLLIIDAQAENSVFLPSKLIDYIGAGRPILGLTPPGTASTLIEQLGGWVAAPGNAPATQEALTSFVSFLRHNRKTSQSAWGDSRIRSRYDASTVARQFAGLLKGCLQNA